METGENKSGLPACFGRTDKNELKTNYSLVIESEPARFSFSFLENKASQCVGLCSYNQLFTGVDKSKELKSFIEELPALQKSIAVILSFSEIGNAH